MRPNLKTHIQKMSPVIQYTVTLFEIIDQSLFFTVQIPLTF